MPDSNSDLEKKRIRINAKKFSISFDANSLKINPTGVNPN